MLKKVARIAYTNTEPFFYDWPYNEYPVMSGVPRQLAVAAREGDILAGPLPVVETWSLMDYEPLGFWGISAAQECQSVLLFSNKPISELDNVSIGLTRESSTSVLLLEVLIKQRYKHNVLVHRGVQPGDAGWLVIGDEALKMFHKPELRRFPYMADLATEWWNWQNLPFVFAQWVVLANNNLLSGQLIRAVNSSLSRGLQALPVIAQREARKLGLEPKQVEDYLRGFRYVLGADEEDSMDLFKELVAKTQTSRIEVIRNREELMRWPATNTK